MSATVLPIRPAPSADAAWHSYQCLAERLAEDSRLAADRSFMEEFAIWEAEWKRLYLKECGR